MRGWEVLVVTVICLVVVAQGKVSEGEEIVKQVTSKEGSVDELSATNEIETPNEGAILGVEAPGYYSQPSESNRQDTQYEEPLQLAAKLLLPEAINLQPLLTRNFEVRLGFVLSLLAFLFLIIL